MSKVSSSVMPPENAAADRQKGGLFALVFAFCGSHWRRQPARIAAMFTLVLLATGVEASIPVQFGALIAAVSRGADSAAFAVAMGVIGSGGVVALFRWLNGRLLMRSTMAVMREMAEEGFARIQRFSSHWHASTFAGSTVRAVTRGMWGYDSLGDTLVLGLFPALVVLCSVIGFMTWRWAMLGIVIASGVAVYVAIAVVLIWKFVTPAARDSNRADSAMSGALSDAVTCHAVVRSFAAEGREKARLAEFVGQWRQLVTITWSRYIWTAFAQNCVTLALQGAILMVGLSLWRQGRAGPGDIAYMMTTFTLLGGYLRDMATHFRGLLRSVSDIEELARFSVQPVGIQDKPNAMALVTAAGRIQFQNVSFVYPGRTQPVYRNLSVDIAGGSRIGLVGPSGSGKSTFVRLLQRLFEVDAGRILIDGQNLAEVTQQSLRRAVTVVAQEPILFHRTLAENIAYAKPEASRAELIAAAKRAHAHDFITNLPLGYDTPVGERGIKLSGGERQRITLARAVLADAPILVLDEATSSLDSVSEHLLQQAIEEVARDRTTIIIAHRLSTVKRVDRILLFDQGEIVEDGHHQHLLANAGGHYRRLFETQLLGLSETVPAQPCEGAADPADPDRGRRIYGISSAT